MRPLGRVMTAEDRQWRLPWWAVLAVMAGGLPVVVLLYRYGQLALARPILYSAFMIVVAAALRWRLRRRVWFWITMGVITALHVPLVLYVPWTTKWVPAFMIVPIALADLYAMLAIIAVVGSYVDGRPKAAT
jgi:hypothetical protein